MNPRLYNAILVARDKQTTPGTVSDEQALKFFIDVMVQIPRCIRTMKNSEIEANQGAGILLFKVELGPDARDALLKNIFKAMLEEPAAPAEPVPAVTVQ